MNRLKRTLAAGSAGNEHLTAVVGALLILLLAVEGATLLNLNALLTVHAFVGMLVIPAIGLKLASTGWRALRYYRGADEYVRRGPPAALMRVLVAPLVVLSTAVLFGTGVALLALGETHGTLVGLHKAGFLVWFGATGVHVLAHLPRMPRLLRGRAPGAALRVGLVAGVLAAGAALAVATLPAADALQDHVTARIGIDAA